MLVLGRNHEIRTRKGLFVMCRIIFSNSFFKSQSEAAALNSLLNSFRRFCGLAYHELEFEISDKCEGIERFIGVCIEVSEKRMNLVYTPSEKERLEIYRVAENILSELSELDQRLKDAVSLFLDNKLWELEILFLFCQENKNICECLVKKYDKNLLEKDIREDTRYNNRYVNFMIQYYKYLVFKLEIEQQRDLYPEYVDELYKKISSDALQLWKKTDHIMYFRLACTIMENTDDVKTTEKMYLRYIRELGKYEGLNHEISEAYYDLGRYLELCLKKNKSKYEYYKRQIPHYYRESLNYYGDNFRARYKIAFKADSLFGIRKGMLVQLIQLRSFLKQREKTIDADIRLFLYDYKVSYHLGVLELKANDNPLNAMNLFKEAETLFEVTIMNIWKRLGLHVYVGSEEELLKYVHAELMYNYMANMYLQSEGSDSKNYIESVNKRNRLAKA